MNAITIENLSEKYRIKFVVSGKVSWEEIWALQDVNLLVEKGEVLGIIGQNGAGKTTLLRLIAGMLLPDRGKISVDGRVTAIMELGAGFNLEFTGRENIVLNARTYGVSEELLETKIEAIIEFSGLGKFADAPIKYYSQGMYMRLAFALAIFSAPDILLVDDILAVGDEEAQKKCIKKVFELRSEGKTIIVVSHDMGMVSRLCDRVVLMEKGKVLNQGSPQSVISYYIETSGNQKGIRALGNGSVRVVFNNGRLFLNYGGVMLSGGTGSCGVIASRQSPVRLLSPNFSWEVQDAEGDSFAVLGTMGAGQLSQVWKVGLEGSKTDVVMAAQGGAINESYMDFPFISQYSKCLTFDRETVFPNFIHRSDWNEIGLSALESGVLGLIPTEDRPDLPYVAIVAEASGCVLKVFNSGYELEARIVQARFDPREGGAVSFSMLKTKDEFDRFFHKLEKEYAARAVTSKVLQAAPCQVMEDASGLVCSGTEQDFLGYSISSGDMRLFVDLPNKAVRLFCKEQEMTGLQGGFYTPVPLADTIMSVRKISERHMVLMLNYGAPTRDLTQTWNFSFQDEGALEILVEIQTPREILLKDCSLRLELKDMYQSWRTEHEQEAFCFSACEKDFSAVRLKESRTAKIVLSSAGPDAPLSSISFEVCQHAEQALLGLFRTTDHDGRSYISVQFSKIIPYQKISLPAGKHVYFHSKISFNKNEDFRHRSVSGCYHKIQEGMLGVAFMNGKGAIFFDQKELTLGLGIYTSLRFSGLWVDSYQAAWELVGRTDKQLTVLGHWPYIPISQRWVISLERGSKISWKVDMQVHEKFDLEIEQSNLMLSSGYTNWAIPGMGRGFFTEDHTTKYDILPFRFWSGNTHEISAWQEDFPAIKFRRDLKNAGSKGVIENTDAVFRARLLQFQQERATPVLPGSYTYFEGEIEVEA